MSNERHRKVSTPKPLCCAAPCLGRLAAGVGLMFVAFGKSFDAFEAQMRRMVGQEDGIVDALFRISRPLTGANFWCPPMRNGRLDLRALKL